MSGEKPGLLLDLGNSSAKYRLLTGLSKLDGRLEYGSMESVITEIRDQAEPEAIFVAAVTAGATRDQLVSLCQSTWPGAALHSLVSPQAAFGLVNGYRDPAQLGIDRWLAMVAAWHRWQEALVVVDCGTAMTIDLVDGQGLFRGGIIFPGREVFLRVFEHSVPHLDVPGPDHGRFPPDSTADAIAAGVELGSIAVIEKFVDNATLEISARPRVVITGGCRDSVATALGPTVEICSNLVLDGLQIYFENEISRTGSCVK